MPAALLKIIEQTVEFQQLEVISEREKESPSTAIQAD